MRVSELPPAASGGLVGNEVVVLEQDGVVVRSPVTDLIAAVASEVVSGVSSVNGQTGVVTLDYVDVQATADPSYLPTVSGLTGAEILTVEQGGASVQATTQQIADLAAAGGSGTPAGSNKQVQYNNSGAFGAEAGFEYDATDNRLDVPRGNFGAVDGDLNSIAGDDDHWFQISNDPSVVAGLGTAGKQLFRINSYGAAGYGGDMHFCRYRGTAASPTAVQSGDTFMSFGIRGWDSGGALSQSAASWAAVATENWTGSAHGIKFVWQVTANGSTTRANGMELTSSGLAVTGTLSATSTVTGSNLSGTNTGDQSLFSTIAVSGQSNVVADSTSDTLTLVAGTNVTITTDAATDSITIAASGGGGGSTQGAHDIYIPAGAMRPAISGGCQNITGITTAANQPDIFSLDFDATTEEYAWASFVPPKSWNAGTITVKFHWSHAATATNFGVVWGAAGVVCSDTDSQAAALGTAQTVTDTGGTTNALYQSAATSAITLAGTPAKLDMVHLRVHRKAADASDTLAIDARLQGITVTLTTDADTDV